MKQTRKTSVFCIIAYFFCVGLLHASEREVSFNQGWKFHLGSVANAEQPQYDDSQWRTLDLPHDWSVEPVLYQQEGITIGPFTRLSEKRYPADRQMGGGAWDVGQTMGGEGWYRKTFALSPEDADKRIVLYIEAASAQSEVWVNGQKAYYNVYSYTPYRIDITDYLHKPGTENLIAVKAVNNGHNSRWYIGSGLYRNVWLIKTNKLHLDKWDTYIDASKVNGKKSAEVSFSTFIRNKGRQDGQASEGLLTLRILAPDGTEAYRTQLNTSLGDSTKVEADFTLKKPALWSIDTPQLYTAEVSLSEAGQERDRISLTFGIRSLSFSAEKGFMLNGQPMKLKGGCLHHDNGLLGSAAFARAEERKVELMKANGYNAVRCSHNLASESFYEACDRLGLLVIHETFDQWLSAKRLDDYHQYFSEWCESDLSAGIRRDRNHPCIILWSIGNEIPDRADEAGIEAAHRLINTIHRYDTTRLVTAGVNDFWDRRRYSWEKDSWRAFDYLGVGGYNYMWNKYEADHERYPERIIYGSESFPKELAQNWNLVEKHPYIIGDFVWTAIDYLGEAGLAHALELAPGEHSPQFMDWPWYNAWCGDIDLCGDKKPQSYYRDVVWRVRPITMAVHAPIASGKREDVNGWGWPNELQTWNWPGREGQTMTVNVYSRARKVKLFLNEKLLGEKEVNTENYTATFEVPYEPGVLTAQTVDKQKSTFTLKTSGQPASISLTVDRTHLPASSGEIAFVQVSILDAEGNVVPDAVVPLRLELSGCATLAASGNGGYDDMESFGSFTPKTFRGKAIAVLRSTGEKGNIRLTVSNEELGQADVTVVAE
ncbi:MAG: glycoside hydrolase family 2 TIM barrel-domain containing protein [Bacteroides sp.]|nr:glycoside hydrolase family 2 TIM barrel-domain containing protein [Bacteroides sp.]